MMPVIILMHEVVIWKCHYSYLGDLNGLPHRVGGTQLSIGW